VANAQVQNVERSKYYKIQQELSSWPANSRELNIIEKVRGWIENRLNKQAPIYKKHELMTRVRELWAEVDINFLQNMCTSYEDTRTSCGHSTTQRVTE
jgi:intein/homing endonuclease